ncbi:hypothetical protein CRENBAI_016748 [Crenichthys baileyi]|uniref:Secreted protein n=1 Tax=Crenichthys baileyi TaxID=28760 RepID=A0AAV9QR17_9TELE
MCRPHILHKAFSSFFSSRPVFSSLSLSLSLPLCLSLTIPFLWVTTQHFSISCGCDVSPPQAISRDLSAFFQAIHKNSASIHKRRLHPYLQCPLRSELQISPMASRSLKAWNY